MRYCGYVAGFQYYDGPALLDRMRRARQLTLRRDRHNPHDPNAIRLYFGQQLIGYVPRGPNAELSRRMDRAEPLVCRIEEVQPQSKPWRQVAIRIESLSIARVLSFDPDDRSAAYVTRLAD